MRLTSFTAIVAAVALGFAFTQTANAQIAVSGSFGIDAQSNPISGWTLTNVPGGSTTGVTGTITTTSGLAGIADHGHNVAEMSFAGGSNSAELQILSPAGALTNTGWYSSPNSSTGNNTPWIQVSWIANNTEGTKATPATEWFASNYLAPFGGVAGSPGFYDNRITGALNIFGLGIYNSQRWDTGPGAAGTQEAVWGSGGTSTAPNTYTEYTDRYEKNADGTFNIKVNGGAAYGNSEVDNIDFYSGTGTDASEGQMKAGQGTSWGIWQALEMRRRSAEVGDVAYFTDLKLGSLHYVKGDMNGDGAANNFDIAPFELALTNPGFKGSAGSFVDTYPLVTDYQERGDTNYDHALNNFDISGFEAGLTGGFGPSAAVPEPSTLVLLAMGGVGLALTRIRKRLFAKRS